MGATLDRRLVFPIFFQSLSNTVLLVMRLLLIEDDQRLTRLIAQELAEEHYTVDVAHDGESGLELALRGAHDVAIVDWMLPRRDGPSVVKRQNRERIIRVDVNLRGRDLVSWVDEAQKKVAAKAKVPTGYRIAWGGQFENFERASKRLALVVPAVVVVIFGMLFWMFGSGRPAFAVFLLVPFAATGGMLGLLARGMPFSLPAAIGFIALGGVSVLNGVVMATSTKRALEGGMPLGTAVATGAAKSIRAVLTTAAVAGLGFLPMALSSSAGSEVQRPLATVVIVGIFFSTALTLLVLPGLLSLSLRPSDPHAPSPDDDDPAPATDQGSDKVPEHA